MKRDKRPAEPSAGPIDHVSFAMPRAHWFSYHEYEEAPTLLLIGNHSTSTPTIQFRPSCSLSGGESVESESSRFGMNLDIEWARHKEETTGNKRERQRWSPSVQLNELFVCLDDWFAESFKMRYFAFGAHLNKSCACWARTSTSLHNTIYISAHKRPTRAFEL